MISFFFKLNSKNIEFRINSVTPLSHCQTCDLGITNELKTTPCSCLSQKLTRGDRSTTMYKEISTFLNLLIPNGMDKGEFLMFNLRILQNESSVHRIHIFSSLGENFSDVN